MLTHYLECPVLWQFAREALRLQEDSIFLLSRLCIVEPSICKLRLLAFTHCLYHAPKNDPRGVKANGFPVSPNSMQILASEISRSTRYTIPGVTAGAVLTLSRSRDLFLKNKISACVAWASLGGNLSLSGTSVLSESSFFKDDSDIDHVRSVSASLGYWAH